MIRDRDGRKKNEQELGDTGMSHAGRVPSATGLARRAAPD